MCGRGLCLVRPMLLSFVEYILAVEDAVSRTCSKIRASHMILCLSCQAKREPD